MTSTSARAAPIAERYLSTAEALAYLATIGLPSSRNTLDRLHAEGVLTRYKTRGRSRIAYRTGDLLAAIIEEDETCLSHSKSAAKSGTSKAPSLVSKFEKARALATASRQSFTKTSAKPKSSNVTALDARRR